MESSYSESYIKNMSQEQVVAAQNEYLSKVYAWMIGGLLTTAITAWLFTVNQWYTFFAGNMIWVLFIAQIGLVLGLSAMIEKISSQVATLLFFAYSLITGIFFSVILLAFTSVEIYTTFFITTSMFAALSIFGYVTKKDLSGLGRFAFMGLIGVLVAIMVNIFLQSSMLSFVVNIIGVIVFSALTAYDTQKLKEMYVLQYQGSEIAAKGAIIGALALYLDFINLFLFILRLVGGGRD